MGHPGTAEALWVKQQSVRAASPSSLASKSWGDNSNRWRSGCYCLPGAILNKITDALIYSTSAITLQGMPFTPFLRPKLKFGHFRNLFKGRTG